MEVRWFGADWDSDKCVVAFEMDGRINRRRVSRHPEAVAAFMAEFGPMEAMVGIECGDSLWPRLWRNAGATVWVFDGQKTRRFGQSLHSSGASDDKRAATDLLAMVQSASHRAKANVEAPAETRRLKRLLTMADLASTELARHENRLRSTLRSVHPALALAVGRSFRAAWFLRALTLAPTPLAWRELDHSMKLTALAGSSTKKRPKLFTAFGEDWNAFDPVEESAVRLQIKLLAHKIKVAADHHKQVKTALTDAIKNCSSSATIAALPGLGPYLGATIAIALDLAIPGDRDSMAVQLAAAPVTRRSGTTGDRHPSVKMRRAAPRAMKKATHLLGFQLVGHYRWAKAQYAYYRAQAKKGADAFRRVVRSFLRIVAALHRTNTTFDEARYIETLQRKGVPWAMALDTHDLRLEPKPALIEAAPS